MSNKYILIFLWLFISCLTFGQEQKAKRITEVLCSDSIYGRGYVENGVNKASNFLKEEFQKSALLPYFGDTSYFQNFSLDVNTFPGQMSVAIDGKQLQPGIDFIVNESSGSFQGKLDLIEVDTSALSNLHLMDPKVEMVRTGQKNGFYIDLSGMSPRATYTAVHNFNALA